MGNFKIYYLSSSADIYNFRYVGYTKKEVKERLAQHLYSFKYLKTHKDKWIQQQLNLGNTIIINLIENGIEEQKIEEIEINHIKLLKEQGFNLTNSTDGGDGNKNPSLETRQKISLKNKGKTPRKGAILSNVTKEKIRQKHIGKKASEETKLKISNAGFKRKHSEKTKIKMSLNNSRVNLGKKLTNEEVKKMSDTAKKKPVLQYSKDNILISEFISTKEASIITNINKDTIGKCCNNKRKYAGGYIWKFKNKSDIANMKYLNNIKKPVLQYSLNGDFIKEYASITDATKSTNGHRNHISDCCNEKARSSGGFIWGYKK